MMKKRLTIPKATLKVLQQFGNINDVVSNILSLVENNILSVDNLPSAFTTHTDCVKTTIFITNAWYISNEEVRKSFSLTRLLQYFVDNELYNELNWQCVTDTNATNKLQLYLHEAQEALFKAINLKPTCIDTLVDIVAQIDNILW